MSEWCQKTPRTTISHKRKVECFKDSLNDFLLLIMWMRVGVLRKENSVHSAIYFQGSWEIVRRLLQKQSFGNTPVCLQEGPQHRDCYAECSWLSVSKGGERLVSRSALLDFSTAFDTLDHSILLRRIKATFVVRGTPLEWLASYFRDHCLSWLMVLCQRLAPFV